MVELFLFAVVINVQPTAYYTCIASLRVGTCIMLPHGN